jgi:hypothetical protein
MRCTTNEEEDIFRWLEKGLLLSAEFQTPEPTAAHASPQDVLQRDYLLSLVEEFHACVAYLHGRRMKVKTLEITSEAAVQDLLYLMLKPVFPELSFEDPSPKSTASYAIKDFSFPSMKLVLEAKYIGERSDVKAVEKQLADDIWKYSTHSDCEDLVFFIYDPNLYIADRRNFAAKMSRKRGEYIHQGRPVRIQTIIKP